MSERCCNFQECVEIPTKTTPDECTAHRMSIFTKTFHEQSHNGFVLGLFTARFVQKNILISKYLLFKNQKNLKEAY